MVDFIVLQKELIPPPQPRQSGVLPYSSVYKPHPLCLALIDAWVNPSRFSNLGCIYLSGYAYQPLIRWGFLLKRWFFENRNASIGRKWNEFSHTKGYGGMNLSVSGQKIDDGFVAVLSMINTPLIGWVEKCSTWNMFLFPKEVLKTVMAYSWVIP